MSSIVLKLQLQMEPPKVSTVRFPLFDGGNLPTTYLELAEAVTENFEKVSASV